MVKMSFLLMEAGLFPNVKRPKSKICTWLNKDFANT